MTSVPHNRGFTLLELTVSILIVLIMAAILFPVFAPGRRGGHRYTCFSQEKQIALGFLQYIQDYDEKFPPVVGFTYAISPGTGQPDKLKGLVPQSWGPDQHFDNGSTVAGIISPYMRANSLFIDPTVPEQEQKKKDHGVTLFYIYNDLLAIQFAYRITSIEETVLVTDAENRFANAGHAFTPDSGPFPATFATSGKCEPGQGASIREARSRHRGSSNFAFADGHVKPFKKEENGTDPIFFPPRESDSISAVDPTTKQQIGPIPGKGMMFQGRSYIGTFHIR